MTTYGPSSTGFVTKPLDVIRTEITNDVIAGVSPTLIVTDRTPVGQRTGATANQISQVWEAMQALVASRKVDSAIGAELDDLLTPIIGPRTAETFATVNMNFTLAAGSYPVGSLIVYASGLANIRFKNTVAYTTSGASFTDQPFTCEISGSGGYANANTLTQIASNPGGFSAANNPIAATQGKDAESDYAYRTRWLQSLSTFGSTSVDAIRADLLNPDLTPNVSSASVYGNETASVDGNGLDPYSIMAVVVGGTDAAVAATIFKSKAAPTATTGTTSVTVNDSQGNPHVIKFVRPTAVKPYAIMNVDVLTGVYDPGPLGNNTVEIAIHTCGKNWGPGWYDIVFNSDTDTSTYDIWPTGQDIIYSRLIAAVMQLPGVVRVTSLTLGTTPSPVGTTDIPISITQYGDFDYSRVTVNINYISAAP